MNISYFINKFYSCSKKNIENCENREKRLSLIIQLIGDLNEAEFSYSIRGLARALNISRKLVAKAINIVLFPFLSILSNISKETRGRKLYEFHHPKIIKDLHEICKFVENADSGMQNDIIYIDYTLSDMKEKLINEYNYLREEAPCEHTISRILKEYFGYKLTKIKKSKVLKKIPETDAIFAHVKLRLLAVELSGDDTIAWSIDDKAKKPLGNFSENGKSYANKKANDHDTNYEKVITSFGILNLKTNKTYVYCTDNNSTAEFKVDCIEERLNEELKTNPNIKKLMLFLDNGPENSSARSLWIYKLIETAKKYNITIELVYYPPYHSKYNKIEHYWGVLQRKWSKEIIKTEKKLIEVINHTKWHNIKSEGYFRDKKYEKGIKIDKEILDVLKEKHISHGSTKLKKWSVIITP